MRIGLLLPSSNYINRLAKDIRQSLQAALVDGGVEDFDLIVETTPHNEVPTVVWSKLQKLIVKEGVDVIIAPLNPGMIDEVADLMFAEEVPLIALTMGEDIVRGEIKPPWIFQNSFNLWRSVWLAGYYSVRNHGPRGAIVVAPHEAGYGLVDALSQGIEAASGSVLGVLPCPLNADAKMVSDRFNWAVEDKSDFIASIGYDDAEDAIGTAVSALEISVPIVGLPPTAYSSSKSLDLTSQLAGQVFTSWNPYLPAAKAHIDAFVEQFDKPAHAYALLAHEVGYLLAAAFQKLDGPLSGKRLCKALLCAEFDGPRGLIRFDPQSQEIVTDQYKITGCFDSSEREFAAVEMPAQLVGAVARCRTNSEKHGWLNPYLIA